MTIDEYKDFLHSSKKFICDDGIWYAADDSCVSYPKEGNDVCFQVEETSFWFQHRNKCIVSLIKKQREKDLFFDIGGGNGFVAKALENENIPVVLVEPGRGGVSNAKLRNVSNIFCGTLHDLLPLRGKLTAIGTFDVIEHLADDNAFVAEANEMLHKDGLLYVTVPAFNFLWSNDDIEAGHHRRYRLSEIANLLKKNNFEIVYSTYFFSVLLPPLFVFRTIASKFRIHKKQTSNIRKEHKPRKGIVGKILNMVWNWELTMIKQARYIPFGTSCLIIGKKVK